MRAIKTITKNNITVDLPHALSLVRDKINLITVIILLIILYYLIYIG